MANSKVSAYSAVTALASTDVLYAVASGASKKITAANLINTLTGTVGLGVKDSTTSTDLAYLKLATARSANTYFGIAVQTSTFSGGPDGASTRDDVLVMGYNVTQGGNAIDTSLPKIAFQIEASYWNGTYLAQEWIFGVTNSVAKSSYAFRPMEFTWDTDNSVSNATSVANWQFRMGQAAGSFMRFGTSDNPQILAIQTDNSVVLGFDGTEGLSVLASQSGGNSLVTYAISGGVGTAYHAFGNGLSLGGVGAVGAYDLKAGGSIYITNDVVCGNVKGKATGTGGFIAYDWYNEAGSLSGTPVPCRVILNGVDHWVPAYPTKT